jgi:hypothetical protein
MLYIVHTVVHTVLHTFTSHIKNLHCLTLDVRVRASSWSTRYCASLSIVIDEHEMWKGINCDRESNVLGKGDIVFAAPSPMTARVGGRGCHGPLLPNPRVY